LPGDGRPVGVVVHHVASVYPIELDLARTVASGKPIVGITYEDAIRKMNAQHATDNAKAPKKDTLDLLRRNSAAAAKAVRAFGDALAHPGTTYAADDDPELIAQAAPFSLKLIESLLESSPKHEGLLLAAASGFTQYSYAWVQQRADFVEDTSVARAAALRLRARKLDLRARDYGLRGLDVR